jgi:hypothetical protein
MLQVARMLLPSTRARTTCARRSGESWFILTIMLDRSGFVKPLTAVLYSTSRKVRK